MTGLAFRMLLVSAAERDHRPRCVLQGGLMELTNLGEPSEVDVRRSGEEFLVDLRLGRWLPRATDSTQQLLLQGHLCWLQGIAVPEKWVTIAESRERYHLGPYFGGCAPGQA